MEELGPEFRYLKGPDNHLADALSDLETAQPIAMTLSDLNIDETMHYADNSALRDEIFNSAGDDRIPKYLYPLSARVIALEQQRDEELLGLLRLNPECFTKKWRMQN